MFLLVIVGVNKMRTIILFIGILLVGVGTPLYCWYLLDVPEEIHPVQKYNPPEEIKYNEPTLGMDFIEFSELCNFGDSNSDKISRNRTSTNDIIISRLGETTKRLSNGCHGTFTFRNTKLITIYN